MGCYYGLKLFWKGGICWQLEKLMTATSWEKCRHYPIWWDWGEGQEAIWSKAPTGEGRSEEVLKEADELALKANWIQIPKEQVPRESIGRGVYVRVAQALKSRGRKAIVTEAKTERIRGQERISVFYETWRTKKSWGLVGTTVNLSELW